MITLTSGDTSPLSLTAESNGSAFDLTNASFQTLIKGAKGTRIIGNSAHAIVSAPAGTYTVTLSAADYEAIGTGVGKEIVTKVTQGSNVTHFRATNILTIYPGIPER